MSSTTRTYRPAKVHRHSINRVVGMVAPVVRTLAVSVWAYDVDDVDLSNCSYETGSDTTPVLAVVAKQQDNFSLASVEPPTWTPQTVADMRKSDWRHTESFTLYEALVADPEQGYGLAEASVVLEGTNIVFEIVAAPWPAEEDDERLKPVLARLKWQVFQKLGVSATAAEMRGAAAQAKATTSVLEIAKPISMAELLKMARTCGRVLAERSMTNDGIPANGVIEVVGNDVENASLQWEASPEDRALLKAEYMKGVKDYLAELPATPVRAENLHYFNVELAIKQARADGRVLAEQALAAGVPPREVAGVVSTNLVKLEPIWRVSPEDVQRLQAEYLLGVQDHLISLLPPDEAKKARLHRLVWGTHGADGADRDDQGTAVPNGDN